MLAISKALELKASGLLWEPELLDFFTFCAEFDGVEPYVVCVAKTTEDCNQIRNLFTTDKDNATGIIWLPSLSQLLEEIKARGYTWEMGTGMVHGGPLDPVMRQAGYWCEAFLGNKLAHRVTRAETPEDAAAGVLLAILRRDETYCAVWK